jgi:glycosyltransferase involved in cell wall biosynthesis
VLVGSGPEESALKQEAGEPDLINKVTFLPPQSRDELAKLYRLFDVLVLPSKTDYFWKEQYGRVLVEAMACGTPVMGSRSGAIPAVIDRAERCFPEGDIGQMVQIVQSLTSLEEEKQSLQNRSELGSAQHFVSAYLNLYAELKGAVS